MENSNYLRNSPIAIPNVGIAERWISLLSGVCLAATSGRKGSTMGMLLAGEMMRRGITGHCYAYQFLGVRSAPAGKATIPYELGVYARAAVTIAKSRQEIFRFFREFENLPKVMQHLESVTPRGDKFSHWVALGPTGVRVEWDAEINNEIENELIGWRSLPGADVDSAGSVNFKDAPGGRGTEVIVRLQYNPPAGLVGATVAKWFGRDPETEIESDLFRLKQYLECGEIARTEGQPQGTAFPQRKPVARQQESQASQSQVQHEVSA